MLGKLGVVVQCWKAVKCHQVCFLGYHGGNGVMVRVGVRCGVVAWAAKGNDGGGGIGDGGQWWGWWRGEQCLL